MRGIWQDIRYGLRVLAKSPGFTVVVVLSLAIGIGASTVVFSWVEGVLLRPLPGVEKPEGLVAFETFASKSDFVGLSYPDYRDYRDHLKLLAGLATTEFTPLSVGREGRAEQLAGEMVSGNYFTVLGVRPVLGRVFTQGEIGDKPGGSPVAVISSRLWRTRYNADPEIVGKAIRVNQHDLTVIGVAPLDFRGAVAGLRSDLWVPYMMHPELQAVGEWMLADRGNRNIFGIARLRAGVNLAQANGEISALARRMSKANVPQDTGITATVVPIWKWKYGAQSLLLRPLEILMAVCLVVLLIVCANVANLLLARFSARQKEFSMRLALGAGRFRLARQILTESGLLAGAGGLAGVALASSLGGALQSLVPPGYLGVALSAPLNWAVLVFALVVCAAAALFSGLAPAIHSARAEVGESLKEGGRSGAVGHESRRLRSALVVAEMAMALVALVCAGLLARSFEATRSVNPEFDSRHVLMARFFINASGQSLEQRKIFCERLREKLETSPGVRDAAYSDVEPLGIYAGWWETIQVQGYVPAPGENMKIDRAVVSPGYFNLMHIPLLEGRDFTKQDELKSQPVMIVNQSFVKRFFGRQEAIGQKVNALGKWFTVVGVARDSKYNKLTEAPTPFFYVPFQQVYRADMGLAFFVRVSGNPNRAISIVSRDVREVDPNVTVADAVPLADHVLATLYAQKLAATFLSVLGGLALLLAAVGLYSVMAYSVMQRTHELGIRMALGAQRKDILELVVGQGFVLTIVGIVVGIVAALGLMRLMGSFLYGVTTSDPITFVAASILLAGVSLAANLIPARRATKVDPIIALRYE